MQTLTKVRIYKVTVFTISLYGSGVRNITQSQMKRFEVFHQRYLRGIIKIRWNYFVSNAEVLKRANITPVDLLEQLVPGGLDMWFSGGLLMQFFPDILQPHINIIN